MIQTSIRAQEARWGKMSMLMCRKMCFSKVHKEGQIRGQFWGGYFRSNTPVQHLDALLILIISHWVWSSLLHSSHGDAPVNDRHVQTECSEWGLSAVPAGSVEPAPECQRKRPLQPKLFNKAWTARPLFSLACLHDPDRQSGDGGKNTKAEKKATGQQHARDRNEKKTSVKQFLWQ